MSSKDYDIDPEENERAYQQILEREKFDDAFEGYLARQTDIYIWAVHHKSLVNYAVATL